MIHTLQRRVDIEGGVASTYYEVMQYARRNAMGNLINGDVLFRGSKKECKQYILENNIVIE